MKHLKITTAMMLAALATPALAEQDPNRQAPANPQPAVLQADVDITTSRAMTPEELERWGILELVEGVERIEAQPREFVRGPFLGVNAKPLDVETAKSLGLKRSTGLMVNYVAGGGPASKAGLKKGDVLTKLNDQVLVNAEQFAVLVRGHAIGDAVTLHGLRDGEAIELNAELGEADIMPLGPGGSELDQKWRVQLNPAQGPIGNPLRPEVEIAPGLWIGDGWGDPAQLPANPQDMPEALRDKIKELEQQMFQQREDMDRKIRQMCLQLDLDLDALRNQANQQADGKRMHAAIVQFDGKHRIEIKNSDGVPHLNIRDKQGDVLFDGPLPANGVVEELPEEVQVKLSLLMLPPKLDNGVGVAKEIEHLEHIIPPAPKISVNEALPNTLAALDALDKIADDLIFDVWHGADLDLDMLRETLDLEDPDAGFDRDGFITALQSIYTKIAGNSEMRSVLAQIEVREAIKADLGTVGQMFGENERARDAVQKLIQRINSDLLIQHNDDEHEIRLEGVGLLQRLTITSSDNGEVIYEGFARVSHEFLSGKTDEPGIQEIKDQPDAIKAKVKKMLLSDKRIRSLLSDGC